MLYKLQVVFCYFLFCFGFFFSEAAIRDAIWRQFLFLAGSRRKHDGVQTFKRAQGDTSRGLFHACGILAFLLNSFKISGTAPSLTDTSERQKKKCCLSESTRRRLTFSRVFGSLEQSVGQLGGATVTHSYRHNTRRKSVKDHFVHEGLGWAQLESSSQ